MACLVLSGKSDRVPDTEAPGQQALVEDPNKPHLHPHDHCFSSTTDPLWVLIIASRTGMRFIKDHARRNSGWSSLLTASGGQPPTTLSLGLHPLLGRHDSANLPSHPWPRNASSHRSCRRCVSLFCSPFSASATGKAAASPKPPWTRECFFHNW